MATRKITTSTSLERIRAITNVAHFPNHPLVASHENPARAIGANTIATNRSALRIRSENHTIAAALMADGVKPGPLFQRLKHGETVTLEDGRVINGQDYLAAPQPGKKLVIFGDTAPCPAALTLAQGVDVMVHEATLETAMEEKANSRGHSSTRQAALLARDAAVGRLIITHVSSRYDARGAKACWQSVGRCSRNVSWPKISLRLAFSPSFFPQDADND